MCNAVENYYAIHFLFSLYQFIFYEGDRSSAELKTKPHITTGSWWGARPQNGILRVRISAGRNRVLRITVSIKLDVLKACSSSE